MQHIVEPGWRDDQGRHGRRPEYRGAQVAPRGVDQGLRQEAQRLEGATVGAQRALVLRAALDVLERQARHPAYRELAQVRDVARAGQGPAPEWAPFPGDAL